MPKITTAGTFPASMTGLELLKAKYVSRSLLFAGSSVGTTTDIKYTDDAGQDHVIANGSITALPTSISINAEVDLKIVTTGSPNFNVTVRRDSNTV